MEQYDFIIVGAGSAGCALAHRLTERPDFNVLLIEAGPQDPGFFSRMPMGFKQLFQNPKFDWNYRPESNPNMPARPQPWIRGKMLGGSSAINGMVYVRGQPEDFDGWAALGNVGWGWQDVLPVYRSMENHELGADDCRGAGGLVDVTCARESNELSDAYIEAAVQLGLPRKVDLNRPDQVGVGYFQRTIKDGKRVSSATAFLSRCRGKKNLTIICDAHVTKVVTQGRRATGIECLQNGTKRAFAAAKEVILSAGSINSPQLLQLSGIGPAAHLKSAGIEVLHDLPGVGGNLQEHLNAGCVHTVSRGSLNPAFRSWGLVRSMLTYVTLQRGVMAMAAAQVGAFAKTRAGLSRANAQWHMAPLRMVAKGGEDIAGGGDTEMEVAAVGGITSFGCVMHPAPGGDVLIQSSDPLKPPRIRYEHLRSEEDRRTMVKIIQLTRKIAEQPALAPFIQEEVLPGPQVQSDEALLDYATKTGQLGYHPVGTCKMGRDSQAVVSHELKVHGVQGLRVVDASIMPVITSGNTNAPSMMIGFKAGGMILTEYKQG